MKEKIIKDEIIYDGKILKLHIRDVEIGENKIKSKREIVEHKQAICVLPIINNEIYFVKQFRSGTYLDSIELPAGLIDENETPIQACERELSEEIKYTTSNLEYIGAYYTSPGFCNELIHFFIATELHEKYLKEDNDELLEIIKYPIESIKDLLVSNIITDMKTVLLLNIYLNKLNK